MPLALAQALTLGMKVSAGGVSLQEAKDLKFVDETVYDLSDKPLHHLVLMGPETTDLWGTLQNPKPTHALYAVGATDKRSFFSFILPAGSFKSLSDTRAKAASFRRFLSPAAGILNSGSAPSTAYAVAQEMFEPVYLGMRDGQNVYQPRIARYTDTWWFQNSNQGSTRDTNMIPGANNWIQDRASAEGKNWEMRGNHKAWVNVVYSATGWTIVALPIAWIDFSQHTWRVWDIVRGKIGRDNEPVISMYGQGVVGHFAVSQAYIVHEGWFSANVFLWIRRESNSWMQDMLQGSFVNVTDMASFYSGAFGMYRR
ncbi:hypothetical protein [Meiothermus sp.]|uniref:hypothetical protein n=1 Tax=Meiothermus sp. TaxID=1955249 RepID=UPI0026295916|nr:hypothetical protein [Meiothermus sp.]